MTRCTGHKSTAELTGMSDEQKAVAKRTITRELADADAALRDLRHRLWVTPARVADLCVVESMPRLDINTIGEAMGELEDAGRTLDWLPSYVWAWDFDESMDTLNRL